MIITKTPYRLSLFGGGTDYPAWFTENGGVVIAASMARHCYISLRKLPPFFEHRSRLVYSVIESVHQNSEIQHPSIRHCLKFLGVTEGVEIHHDGDLPARSGIGSSSSFTVGLLNAIHALRYQMTTKKDLANEAIHVEQKLIGESVGIQDQIMAAYGGLQTIEMGPGPDYVVKQLLLPPDYLDAFESHFVLGFTGISRTAEEFAKSQVDNIKKEKSVTTLKEIQDISKEALSLLKRNANFEEIGRLFDINWNMKRKLANGVSNDHIDELYAAGKRAGAYGGKLMGAGGGGFMMFFAPPYRHQAIRESLRKIRVWVPFSIDTMGSQVIFHDGSRFQKDMNSYTHQDDTPERHHPFMSPSL